MSRRPEHRPEGFLSLEATRNDPEVATDLEESLRNPESDPSAGGSAPLESLSIAQTSPAVRTTDPSTPSLDSGQGPIDWRTIDPESLRSRSILVEKLLTYRLNRDELMRNALGMYVLIVGSEIVSIIPDLDQAAEFARRYRDRPVLIKKIVEVEPIHTFGGVLPVRSESSRGVNL